MDGYKKIKIVYISVLIFLISTSCGGVKSSYIGGFAPAFDTEITAIDSENTFDSDSTLYTVIDNSEYDSLFLLMLDLKNELAIQNKKLDSVLSLQTRNDLQELMDQIQVPPGIEHIDNSNKKIKETPLNTKKIEQNIIIEEKKQIDNESDNLLNEINNSNDSLKIFRNSDSIEFEDSTNKMSLIHDSLDVQIVKDSSIYYYFFYDLGVTIPKDESELIKIKQISKEDVLKIAMSASTDRIGGSELNHYISNERLDYLKQQLLPYFGKDIFVLENLSDQFATGEVNDNERKVVIKLYFKTKK